MFSKLLAAGDTKGDAIGKGTEEGWKNSLGVLHDLGIVKAEIDPTGKFIQVE